MLWCPLNSLKGTKICTPPPPPVWRSPVGWELRFHHSIIGVIDGMADKLQETPCQDHLVRIDDNTSGALSTARALLTSCGWSVKRALPKNEKVPAILR